MASQMNMNESTSNATVNTKDEQATIAVHENGYESECSSSSRSDEEVTMSALEVEADTFTRFVERQRVEVMFELRNLRMGERPVTGQSNRERIQTFLDDIRERQQPAAQAPSTRPAAVPRAFTADIDALSNRRCVSAALGSTAFRRDLENAIRRTVETRPMPTPAPQQSVPEAPPLPRVLAPINQSQVLTQTTPVTREQARPQVREPFHVERQERELQSWHTITQIQREVIVLEISDLVHRQLVSSALESDFRSHLERSILTRLAQGAPPQLVGEQQQQQMPTISAPRIQPTPTVTRTTTTTRNNAATIDELSTRFDAMQNMLQLMFSMQIDMQRCLRQEISSAISNNPPATTMPNEPVEAGHCTVCLTATADTVLYRCGHLCVCYMCGLNLRETASVNGVKCPICRAPVDDIIRVYRSSRDGEEKNN